MLSDTLVQSLVPGLAYYLTLVDVEQGIDSK